MTQNISSQQNIVANYKTNAYKIHKLFCKINNLFRKFNIVIHIKTLVKWCPFIQIQVLLCKIYGNTAKQTLLSNTLNLFMKNLVTEEKINLL